MALYPVPWFTTGGVEGEGGAENYGELARADAFIGSSGATGIIDPTDFKVVALPTPGPAVRVMKGTGVIRSTYPGVVGQSYVVQERDYTDVPVAATGSSGGATKYVYLLIEDTQFTGQPPVSVEDGPYNSYQVTTTLPQFKPYLLLAKINQPKSRSDIQPEMIEDMREVANPKSSDVWRPRPNVASDKEYVTATGADGEWFPNNGGEQTIYIPDWATRVQISATWSGVRYDSGKNAYGEMWVEFGPYLRPSTRQYSTQRFMYDTAASANTYRTNWIAEDDKYIPAALRGTDQIFVMKARKTGPDKAASIDGMSGVSLKVRFLQLADPSTS